MNSTNRTFWKKLTKPHPAVTELHRRRQAESLSILSLILLTISLIFGAIAYLVTKNTHPGMLAVPLLGFGAYALSRTRWPQIGAWLIIFGQLILDVIFISATGDINLATLSYIFLLFPILLATLVLNARATVLLAGLTALSTALIPLLNPVLSYGKTIVPTSAVVFLSGLASVVALIRERDVQTIEKQADELGDYSQKLEADVERFIVMSEVGQAITATRDLDTLLDQIVNLIIERFDFYHAQVFLLDKTGQHAVLRASTGHAGQELLARGHKLPVGSQSVIGQVTAAGEPVIASDTDVSAVHRRNELLPNTRAEMALPLRVSGQIIGALDIQSINPNAFQPADVSVFQAMADQLATAIENVRLFERAQHDLDDIERLNRQLTGEAWSQFLSGRTHRAPVGYKSGEESIQTITTEENPGEEAYKDGAVTLPLRVRGQTIGTLDLIPRGGEEPDEETQDMLEAVAERVALALDNARLGEQSQRQVAREQVLNRLSVELQATTDLDNILRIVARETSRAMNTSRGFIYLTMEYQTSTQSSD